MREFQLGLRRITDDSAPYVVAEIGNNHGGSLQTAFDMVVSAADSGADAVKFQLRDNGTLYTRALLEKTYENEASYGRTYGEHRAVLELDPVSLLMIRDYARQISLSWFATAFDEPSADLLASMEVPAIKLASGALTDVALQRHVASLQIPIILSTGGGTDIDIDKAVQTITHSHSQLALLHTTASYPLDPKEANLRCILTLRSRYPETVIGYSSHSPGLMIPLIAAAFGASIIEVHVTLDRASKGTDHAFSLEPKGLQTLCDDLKKLHVALGDGVKRWYHSELAPISKMRRRETPDGWKITGELDAPSF